MSKQRFWQRANEDALSVYDAVYASLIGKVQHDAAHIVAMQAYNAVIAEKHAEYQNIVSVKRFSRREKVVLQKLRAEEISRPRRFWNWLIGKTTQETSSVKLAKECVA